MVSTYWKVEIQVFEDFKAKKSLFFRAFVHLSNLLYGIPLVQNVAIVSDRGEIVGYLKIGVQQIQMSMSSSTEEPSNEQIKLMKTYRNASGLTKITFDDETYFKVKEQIDFCLQHYLH